MSLQLTDNLWELKLDTSLDASIVQHPLGSFTNPFIVVHVTSDNALPVWKQAGTIGQAIDFDDNFAHGEIKQVTLNSYLLFQFPLLSGDSYELYYFSLPRLVEVEVKIWQYLGDTTDTSIQQIITALESANLSNLQVNLPEIEIQLQQLQASTNYLQELIKCSNNLEGDTSSNNLPINLNTETGRLEYNHESEIKTVAILADLNTLPDNLVLKSILAEEKIFYVRVSSNFGNSGETENEAFASIEEALITLSAKYEVSGHLILDLDGNYTLNCWYLPNFTGSGQISIKGNDSTIRFIQYQESTTAYFSNWSGLTLCLEDITFDRGECSKLCVEGGKMTFKNIDFGRLNTEFDNCRSTVLDNCTSDPNNSQITGIRSTLELNRCNAIAKFSFCQLNLFACTFNRYFALEACQVTLNNPRFNYRYYTQTLSVINSTIEFKNSWLTFENLGNNPQTRTLITFQSCNLKDFPNNLDIQGNRVFNDASILKLVNCTTPATFPNVNYNFSRHSFIQDASAIELVNTAILQELNIIGAPIKRDVFSILGDSNQLLEMINDLNS